MAWQRGSGGATAAPPDPGAAPPSGLFSALRFRNYRLYWIGQFPSVLGQNMQYVALGWLVLQITNSPLALGVIGLAQSAPQIGLVFVGGAVADRVDRRRLLILTQGLTALLFAVLGILETTGHVAFWHVMTLAFLLGCVRAFDQPSRQGLLPLLIPREEIAQAVPLGNLVWQLTRLLGPAVAGLLIAAVGVGPTFLVASAAFATAMGLFSLIQLAARPAAAPEGGLVQNMLAGLTFIRRDEISAALLGMTFFNSVFGMSYTILMPMIARDLLQVGSEGYGFLQTAGGIGGLLGTLAVSRLAHSGQRGLQILLGGAAFGLLLVGLAFSSSFPVAFALLFFMGAANQMYMTSVNTTLQLQTPDEFRGRVMGVWGLTWSLVPIGGTISGTVAELAGPRMALALGGILVAALALGVLVYRPRIRQLA